ncbi:MAG: hypothetical protein ACO3NZ_14310 [Pirellulales bacterium]
MPVVFRCTNCRRRLQVPRRWAGDAIDCPRCAAKIIVPQQAGVSEGGVFESRSFERSLKKLDPSKSAPDPLGPNGDIGVWDAASLAEINELDFPQLAAGAVVRHGTARTATPRRRSRRVLGLYACVAIAALASAAVVAAFWLFNR